MPSTALLLERLDTIAQVLAATGDGLGVLGLGSVGLETERLDSWSDLDFFLVVKPGTKAQYLTDAGWFSSVAPVSWVFRNTADGYKVLFSDGVLAEMAWFEPSELEKVPYAPGRWIWRAPGWNSGLENPINPGTSGGKPESAEWALGELLSCLHVGLCRWHRGERLSAWRFIQVHCLDRFLEIVDLVQPSDRPFADLFNRDRRWESRHPECEGVLGDFLAGYDRIPQGALALLGWCETHFAVNPAIAAEIRKLSLS